MNNPETVFDNNLFSSTNVNVVNVFTGNDMTIDTYYFNANQATQYEKAEKADECFCFYGGNGKFYLNNGSESTIDVAHGSIVYVPTGVSHKIECTDNQLIAIKSRVAKKYKTP